MAPTESSAPPAAADRRLIAIFLIVFIDVLGLTIILPLLPFYSEKYGASPLVVGLLVASYAACQFISGPILGYWSDRVGRKPILVISQIGTFVGFLILAFAPSLTWIFISRIIDGLTAGNLSTAQAYISDVAQPKDRAKALGKIGIAFGVGFFIGPALTAFLYHYGYRAPIFAAASLSFLSIMASLKLLPNKEQHAAPAQKAAAAPATHFLDYFKNPQLRGLLIEITLFYLAFSAYMSGFALFAERRFQYHGEPLNPKQVGYAFAYYGFVSILVQAGLIGRLVDKWGERRVAWLGFLSCVLGYAVLTWISDPFGILVTGLLISFGSGVLRPVITSSITGKVGPHERGRILGVNQSLQSVAQIAAPLMSTFIIQSVSIHYWALLPAAMSALGLAMMALNSSQV